MNKMAASIVAASIVIGATPALADNFLLEQQAQLESHLTAYTYDQQEAGTVTYGAEPDGNFSTMNFGDAPAGTPITRYFNFSINGAERMALVEVEGNISDKIDYESSQMVSGQGSIPLRFESNETGYFEGDATLTVIGSKGGAGELWLDLKTLY